MPVIEPSSSLLEYNEEFFEIVYSNDQADFFYTPRASPVHPVVASTISTGDLKVPPRRSL